MKEVIADKDIVDIKGWTIPKGTKIFITKEVNIKNPMTKKDEHFKVVKIDNGTNDLNLMPETCIKEVLK